MPATSPYARVLVVEEDRALCGAILATLKTRGFAVALKSWPELRAAQGGCGAYDLCIADLTAPRGGVQDVCRDLCSEAGAPVIAVAGAATAASLAMLLAAGAADFLMAPFGADELLARVGLVLGRAGDRAPAPETLTFGALQISLDEQIVLRDGQPVPLSRTDWELLALLVGNAGRVLTRRMLQQRIWQDDRAGESSMLRTYIGRLRQKLEDDPRNPRYICTEARLGYRFGWPASAPTP